MIPAIDLLGGRAVRLREGRREEATIYSDRPWEVAARFAADGAQRIHVVDLDGAFAGRPENRDAVARILAAGARVQLGGGIRDLETCTALLDSGIDRVVLGTAMVKSRPTVEQACARWPGRVVIAVDARDGRVAIEGWAEATDRDAVALAREAAALGCAAVLYTDIARDGTGRGPNVAATARLAAALAPVEVIASGGIASVEDLRALAGAGVPAAIVGRALYSGAFTLPEAMRAAVGSA